MSIASKLLYLSETKLQMREAIAAAGVSITENTPFRDYVGKINEIAAGVGDPSPDTGEIITWDVQMTEALMWQEDPSAPTPWVNMAASAREIGREDLLNSILTEVERYTQATDYLTGLYQEYETTIDATVDGNE